MSFTFTEQGHEYRLNNHVLPSVTKVMRLIAPARDGIPESILEYASQRGKAVHKAVEIYNNAEEFAEPLDEVIVPYLDAWKRFVDEKKVIITAAEQRLYHQTMMFAGTLDATGEFDDDDWTLDVKAVAKLHDSIGVQLAAYNALRSAQDGLTHHDTHHHFRRGAVQLLPDGTYRLQEYRNKSDWAVFVSCLTIHNYQENHK